MNVADAFEQPASIEAHIGMRFGKRYLLQELVGEGGMAKVWRAFDEHLGRDVALKLLHAHVPPTDRERFRREIRALARLSHPGVISIYDLGEEDGQLYFTMELLVGGNIGELGPLEDEPKELERFLNIAIEITQALTHVHEANMVHRDLTPRNILLDRDSRPRIMDFGLVYVSDATRDLTKTGYTLGTPQYMSPEQAKGGLVSTASDIYALGCVLYRAASGRAPFEADNDQAILYQHVYENAPALENLNPTLPKNFGPSIAKFLSKAPEHRPQRASQEFEALTDDLVRTHIPSTYRGGRSRAGLMLAGPTHPSSLRLAWETQTGGDIAWPAAVIAHRSLLAVGTRAGHLSLLNLGSGAQHIRLMANDEVTAPAAWWGDELVYGAWDGSIRGADWRTGEPRWSHQTRGEITSAPTRVNEHWFVPSRDGSISALRQYEDETVLEWVYKAGSAIAASLVLRGGLLIAADEEGWLYGLEPQTGNLAWKVQLSPIYATPAATRHPQPNARRDAVIVVPTGSGEVYALSLRDDGTLTPDDDPLWVYDLEGEAWASPAIEHDRVFLGSWKGELRALSLRTGDDLWSIDLGARITASPIVSGGIVYAASEAGTIIAVSSDTGRELWRDEVRTSIQGTPLITDHALIVPLLDGRVRCYREV